MVEKLHGSNKMTTIDVENFVGLNLCSFNPTKVFAEILLHFFTQKCLLLKRGTYIHRKTFMLLSKTAKTVKVEPSKSLPVYGISYI